MSKNLGDFLYRFFSNSGKDLFLIRLGSKLLLAKWGIIGFWAKPLEWVIRSFLGVIYEDGVFLIDISLDAIREGMKLDEFKDHATKAYEKATAKIYSEEKKNEIRKEYLDIISKFGSVGNGPADTGVREPAYN